MQIYLITDKAKRVHQFIYPDRIWEQGENGWYSRPLSAADHKQRLSVCTKLVKNAVSGHRLKAEAIPVATPIDSEEDSYVIH